MNELQKLIWTEKYRPKKLDDIIFNDKERIKKYLTTPVSLPSFIFYSSSPGTGKTSLAKIIIDELQCDSLIMNSSIERGIDIVREKIKLFAQSMSSNQKTKRLILMDEADYVTAVAQASLRNMLEEYSDNAFWIFSANDLNKIIEPIRSRCVIFNFERPNKKEIINRLEYICKEEKIEYDIEDLARLINICYPDIRSMILTLQSTKIDNKFLLIEYEEYQDFLKAIKLKDIQTIYSKSFSDNFNILTFVRWFFKYLFENYDKFTYEQVKEISFCLAEIEKNYNLGVNLPIIFIANILKISEILS